MKLKKTRIAGFVLSAFFLTGIFAVASTNAFGQEKEEKQDAKLAKQAKITMAQAREIAQKRRAEKSGGDLFMKIVL
ncbi:MAG: hypothetical protein LH472_00170 [Pyrinomonadaceae bacterium]|nr:hypothetical protein [Pyrinomonadaceae bacterium]